MEGVKWVDKGGFGKLEQVQVWIEPRERMSVVVGHIVGHIELVEVHSELVGEHIELVEKHIELVEVHIELVVGHIEFGVLQQLVRGQVVFQLLDIQLFLEHVQLERIQHINLGRLGEYTQLDVQLGSNQ